MGRSVLEIVLFLVVAASLSAIGLGAVRLLGPWSAIPASVVVSLGLMACFRVIRQRIGPAAIPVPALWPSHRLATGFALGFGLAGTVVLTMWLVGVYRVDTIRLDPGILAARIAPSLHSAVWEEILFRGILFRQLFEWRGRVFATLASAVLFGAMHGVIDGGTPGSAVAVGVEAGLLLSVAYLVSRDLWFPIGMHFGWNLSVGGIFGSPVSGNAVPGLIDATISGPVWLTGGAFGIEGSVLAVAVCVVATLVLWRRGDPSLGPGDAR